MDTGSKPQTTTLLSLIGLSPVACAGPFRLLLLSLTCLCSWFPPTGCSAPGCVVGESVWGVQWSSVSFEGWRALPAGGTGWACVTQCCRQPACSAVWSRGGLCVLLTCPALGGCRLPPASLPPLPTPRHGLLRLLSPRGGGMRRRRSEDGGKGSLESANSPRHTSQDQPPGPGVPKLSSPPQPTPPVTAAYPTALTLKDIKKDDPHTNGSTEPVAPPPTRQSPPPSSGTDTIAASNTSISKGSPPPTTPTTLAPTTPTPAVRELVVSAGNSVEVTLPRNEVELNAFVLPELPAGSDYVFDWRLITHPRDYSGEMEGKHSKTLKLSKLTVGLYEFKVLVEGEGAHGEGYVNVTVKPEPRVNKPPVAVVSPKFQEISLPTSSTVIDGSQSTDDDGIVSWHWEELRGPLREEKVSADTPILTLTNLVPGNYTFSLMVTDSDGAQNSTLATLAVNKAVDYRPVANAGPNQVITLPRNSITLLGNQSSDDHGTLAYEWSLSPASKGKVVEMQGVRTSTLQLSAMQEGDYTFQLTVTDSAGQQDTAEVTVIVQPENNKAPVADAGPEKELTLPVDHTSLDGSKSSDDQSITTYHWTQSGGPAGARLENADSAVATVTGLQVGVYEFTLSVTDERGLQGTDTVSVIVRDEMDQAPVAKVAAGVRVSLPVRTATLDGSHSTDDKGVVSYVWTRDENSPAAGEVLNNSDHQAVLLLGNLVEGKYTFTLMVTDSKGQSSFDHGTVEVRPDPWVREQVELVLDVPVAQLTQRQRGMLLRQVGVLLGVLDSDIVVREVSAFNELSTRLVFLVLGGPGRPPLSGRDVAMTLRSKLRKQKNDFLIFRARRVDTVICQLNCSGHGQCDSFSRSCVCHPFWMENFLLTQLGDSESNCEWSVLYVTIASFLIVVAIGTLVWGVVCCCRRRRGRVRRKSRYKMLEAEEQDSLELQPPRGVRAKPPPPPPSSSLMRSDSELDSDEGATGWPERGQLLRPQNGSVRNGQGPLRAKKQREELL
ncbi:K319L protein, partial [Amia calva]|nr:K319L protein [Amia calva]